MRGCCRIRKAGRISLNIWKPDPGTYNCQWWWQANINRVVAIIISSEDNGNSIGTQKWMLGRIGIINGHQPWIRKTASFQLHCTGDRIVSILFAGYKRNQKNKNEKMGFLHGGFFRLTIPEWLSLHLQVDKSGRCTSAIIHLALPPPFVSIVVSGEWMILL